MNKHGTRKEHKWLKAHICVGVKTNIVTGVVVTKEYANDSPHLPNLVKMTSENGYVIDEVSADKAYSSIKNLQTVKDFGGTPYTPFKSNVNTAARKKWIWKKMYRYFLYMQDEFMEHYHRRSNAETVFHMIKTKFGDKLESKNFIAQTNELLCKVVAHNIVVLIHEMYELGIDPNFNFVPSDSESYS